LSTQHRLSEASISSYLRDRGLLAPGEDAAVEAAFDGNINWVRRVRAGGRRFVLKQARPTLERFPEYSAPTERLICEARYYELAAPFDATGVCPRILHVDAQERVLVLEDLGEAERLDEALQRGAEVTPALRRLGAFLGAVHLGTLDADLARRFQNDGMRRLHGDHIFDLPYRENDFPLSPPLRERAETLWRDTSLVATIDEAYARYLKPEGALVHGDVQGANVLLAERGPVLLDAEIAHVGDPAFDVGSLVAHVLLPATARGEPGAAEAPLRALWSAYQRAAGSAAPGYGSVARYAGIEVLRRTIGAARVACVAEDASALAAIEAGVALVRSPPDAPR
jgi:5-methylthioribose kinase